jgi:2-aminoethanethiol dioxygenase/cysteine oxidase family protein
MEDYSRRHVLKASLWTFGALCLGVPGIIAAAREPGNSSHALLNWEEFVDKLERAAKTQHRLPWNQETYVNSVAQMLAALNLSDSALQRVMADRHNAAIDGPDFADPLKTTDVQISLVTFEKNEWLPHHNHPTMTGVLTCATGDLLVTSYDQVKSTEFSDSSSILIKRVGNEVISPGKISTLTKTQRNIHSVKALSFTQVIDIFTPPYNTERTNRTSWYRVEKRPFRSQDEVWVAHPI